MSERLLLGVEGGGANTQAVLSTLDGQILARGIGPPSNHNRVGLQKACAAIETAVYGAFCQVPHLRLAFPQSQWARAPIAAASFGLAGVDNPADEAMFRTWLEGQQVAFPFTVTNDAELILAGGIPAGWGVALISDAGSVCLGRDKDGVAARVGGWGHILGDEGGGYQIAVGALRLATQAADGRGGSSSLLEAALGYWKLKDPKDLIGVIYHADTSIEMIADFTTRILELAGRRDPAAQSLVERSGEELAAHVDAVIETLALIKPPLALGGRMARTTVLKNAITDRVKAPLGPIHIVTDPVRAAITAAGRLLSAGSA